MGNGDPHTEHSLLDALEHFITVDSIERRGTLSRWRPLDHRLDPSVLERTLQYKVIQA
jgi:hypothetical protein